MTFLASNSRIRIDDAGVINFDTDFRMPHILSSTTGIFSIQDTPISAGPNYVANSTNNIYLASSPVYKAANSFVVAYIMPVNNVERTEINTGNPIFLCGTMCVRIYIENSQYRGALLLTPKAWDNNIGFVQEHTYNFNRATKPNHLFINSTNTHMNPGIAFRYTLYYGRFI